MTRIMPLLVTGAESDLELPTSSILSGKHFIQYGTQRTRADSRPKHWNRMSDSRHVIGNDLKLFISMSMCPCSLDGTTVH